MIFLTAMAGSILLKRKIIGIFIVKVLDFGFH